MADLLTRVRAYAERYALFAAGPTLVVGVSGGADSLCLLHLLLRLQEELSLRLQVAHLNHGLRGAEADADERFVASIAADWGLPCLLGRADIAALAAQTGCSVEETARQERYAFLARTARACGARTIVVGHNADDQAETVLMHLLRGSGVAGLRGMLPRTRLDSYHLTEPVACGDLWLARPLLGVARSEIEAYCTVHGLAPRHDQSNEDLTFYRNRLRHELLPYLSGYNPAIREVLAHTAEVLAGDHEVLRAALERALTAVELPARPGEVRFDLPGWRDLPLGLQRALLRDAVTRLRRGLRNVNWVQIERAVWLGRQGSTGMSATLVGGLALSIGYSDLRVASEGAPPLLEMPQAPGEVPLAAPGLTPLAGGWQVVVRQMPRSDLPPDYTSNPDPWTAWLDARVAGSALALRPRVPGDRFMPQGMGGSHVRLNEFMINARVPREARARWPLLVGQGGIIWVCGLRLDETAVITPATQLAWHVRLERSSGIASRAADGEAGAER